MDTTDIDLFELLSDEVIANIVNFVDLVTLFRFATVSKRLSVFKIIHNDQWRKFYSERWYADDRELAVYKTISWAEFYEKRLLDEKAYKKQIEAARLIEPTQPPSLPTPPVPTEGDNNNEEPEQTPENTNVIASVDPVTSEESVWYKPSTDPWYTLLTSDDFEELNDATDLIEQLFGAPFGKNDLKREILSNRYEILVTALAKISRTHPEILEKLTIFESLLVSDSFKPCRRPIGLLGLLVSVLDIKTDVGILDTVSYCIWRIAQSDAIDDYFIELDIVPRLIHIIEKCEDLTVVNSCIGTLTWYKPKASDPKYFQNGTFAKRIVELLRSVPTSHGLDYECVIKILYKLAPNNAIDVLSEGILEILFQILRGADTNKVHVSYALGALHNFSFFSDEVCLTIAQHETALPILLQLLQATGDYKKEIIDSILYVLNDVALTEIGVDRLLELNALEAILPHLKSEHTSFYASVYNVLNSTVDFANMNGFLPDVLTKLEPYYPSLIDCWEVPEARAAGINFWMTFTCSVSPPRDVSMKLIEKAMKKLPDEKRVDIKRDLTMLLANIIEVDKIAFEGLNMKDLYLLLSDNLVHHDSVKEKAELLKLEQLKATEQASLRRNSEMFGPLETDDDTDEQMTDVKIKSDTHEDSEKMDEDHGADENNKEGEDDEMEEVTDTDMPWPLSLLSYLMQFDDLRQLAVKDEKLMSKMMSLYRDKQQRIESHFLVVFFWTNLLKIPGWNVDEALECIEDFAMSAMFNMRWSFMFSYTEPYMHFFKQDNPAPVVILASWFLAHTSTTEPGRKGLKSLDLNSIKWMDTYPHSRVEFNMTQFHKNMKKKNSRS